MNKDTFIKRLNEVGNYTLDFTMDFVFNKLPEKIVYSIQPNSLEIYNGLDNLEKQNLINRIKELNNVFNIEEVSQRLLIENRVPVWINCSIIRTTKKETLIQLLTSRRFRTDIDLYNKSDKHPPFNINIQYPPYQSIDSKEKFDVNWRYRKIKTAYKMIKQNIKF